MAAGKHHPFTFLEHYVPGVEHENLHVATSVFLVGLLSLGAIAIYPKIKNASKNVLPDGKLSLGSFFEAIVGFIDNLCVDIIGHDGRKYVGFVGSVFCFIFFCNIIGTVPGFLPATESWVTGGSIAIIVFIAFNYFGFKEHGVSYLGHFFAPLSASGINNILVKGVAILGILLFQVLFSSIELFGLLMRPFTLSLRLGINMAADHLVLGIFSGIFEPFTQYIFPLPFIGLGMFVSFMQAFIFTLLTIVYISLAVAHDH